MVTLEDVAKKAQVSASTVSRVLSGKVAVAPDTAKRVRQAVQELEYQPNLLAQGLKGTSLRTIGILLPNVRSLAFPAALRGIEDVAHQAGYTVVFCDTDEDPEKERLYIRNLKQRLIDGLILTTAHPDNPNLADLVAEEFPVVALVRHLEGVSDAIIVDNRAGAYEATKYMLSRGIRRLWVLNGDPKLLLYKERCEGIRQAYQEENISWDQVQIFSTLYDTEDSYRKVQELLQTEALPEGIFALNDPKAIGALRALTEAGISVPEQVSVFGFDDLDVAPWLSPALTTVAQPFYQMGQEACQRLIERITTKEKLPIVQQILPAKLMIRESVR